MGWISTLNMTILAEEIIHIGQLGLKIWVFPCRREQIYLCLSISLGKSMFSPPLPNLDDYLAKIVILSVLIHTMMTRYVPGWILEEKTLIY